MKIYKIILLVIVMSNIALGQENHPVDNSKEDFRMEMEDIDWVIIESEQAIVLDSNDSSNLLIIPGYNEIDTDIKLRTSNSKEEQGYFIFQKGKNLIIRDQRNRGISTTLTIPETQNVKTISLGLQNIYISNFDSEIIAEAKRTGRVNLTQSTGPAAISTNSGSIRIENHEPLKSSISAISSSGNIVLELTENLQADVDLESGTRKIESDFLIKGRSVKDIGERINGKINGGGAKIQLSTTLGRIKLEINN